MSANGCAIYLEIILIIELKLLHFSTNSNILIKFSLLGRMFFLLEFNNSLTH